MSPRLPRKKSRTAIAGVGLWLALSARLGAFNINVSPSVIQAGGPPGGSIAGKIQVTNVGSETLQITARVMDWQYAKPGGEKKFFPMGTTPYSCSSWIRFSPQSFSLRPRETQIVSYSLAIPKGARGSYFSTLLFRSLREGTPSGGITVNLAIEMGSLFFIEIDKTQAPKGNIMNLQVAADPGKPLEASVRFKNEGNTRIEARGRLSILDGRGNAVGWTAFPPIKTLPSDEWTVSTSWPGKLPAGHYRLIFTFELGPGQLLIHEKEIDIQ